MHQLKNKYFCGVLFLLGMIGILTSCFGFHGAGQSRKISIPYEKKENLVVLDPAHPHGANMQLSLQKAFNHKVHVYAPQGTELEESYLSVIKRYNARRNITQPWELSVYTDADYLDKMLKDKKGSVVLIASNNRKKSMYIEQSVKSGLNVIADKPMAITQADFESLESSFVIAQRNKLFISDLQSMSMRNQLTCILQKEFSTLPDVFGTLEKGSFENPAVIQESVHHYFKNNTRPPWFFDASQQGNGIVDVGTHLVDLVQWACFPNSDIRYKSDVEMLSAKTWPTMINPSQFKQATKLNYFPQFLVKNLKDSVLYVDANGTMNYTLKGVHVRITVSWEFQAPKGTQDTYYSLMRGSKANLVITQDDESWPVLLIDPHNIADHGHYEMLLKDHFQHLKEKYPTIDLVKSEGGWRVTSKKKTVEKIDHLVKPTRREVNNMLAKYYTTTQAIEKTKR